MDRGGSGETSTAAPLGEPLGSATAPGSEATSTTSPPAATAPSTSGATTSTAFTSTTVQPTTIASSTTTSSTTVQPTTTTPAPGPIDTGDVAGFQTINARLDDRSLLLALADTSALRSRGLMGVKSLGDLDGMVFAWREPLRISFWMKNTLIPLDIGYFNEQNALFLVLAMVPCAADPCPTHPSQLPIRYALEAAPGFFDDVALGEILSLVETVDSP